MKNQSSAITIGLDLGDKKHAVCVLDAKGEILKQESIINNRTSLTALHRRYPGAVMVMEVGMHSPWTSRFLKDLGHRVLVANPHKVRAIYQNICKSDRRDAEMLARIARTDETLLYPVEHVSEDMQRDLLQIKLRDNLVRQRVDIISSPTRFQRKRDVAAFLGLVPKRDQSGETDKQLRISKAGNCYLRKLLVGSAQYILGPFGPESALRSKGLKLAEKGGPRAKRKAVVAVASNLAVLLLTL